MGDLRISQINLGEIQSSNLSHGENTVSPQLKTDSAPHHKQPNYAEVNPAIPEEWPEDLKAVARLVAKQGESVASAASKTQTKLTKKQGWFGWLGVGKDVNTEEANKLVRWALANGKDVGNSNLIRSALEKTFKDSQQFAWREKTKKAKEAAKSDFTMIVTRMSGKQWAYCSEHLSDAARVAMTDIRWSYEPWSLDNTLKERLSDIPWKPLSFLPMSEDDQKSLNLIASKASASFLKMLTVKTEQEAMAIVPQMVGAFEGEKIQQVSNICTRMIGRRFCANRVFHEGTVGNGFKTQIPEFRKVDFPELERRAYWAKGADDPNPTRVFEMHDPITGRTEIGEVRFKLSEVREVERAQISKALEDGGKKMGTSRDPNDEMNSSETEKDPVRRAIWGALNLEEGAASPLAEKIFAFLEACDAKITELNQKLQKPAG